MPQVLRASRFRRTLIAVFAAVCLAGTSAASPKVDVVVDHDGDVDDLIAIMLLVKSGAVRVRAITICPADSYLDPATRETQLVLDRLGARGITIAQGHNEGTNPFPAPWRKDAARMLEIAPLRGLNPTNHNPVVAADAAHHLASVLAGGNFVILETGPLTNLADALRLNPAIARHIRRIFVMGGAVRVAGNVDEKGRDGSAEWNFYNEPRAAAEMIRSGIPITLVSLDATNHVPLTPRFVDTLAAQSALASQIAADSWRLMLKLVGANQYYFWDTLTAAALLDPDVIKTEPMRVRVLTQGPSQGRTVEDPAGSLIDVAVNADRQAVEKMFSGILGR